MKIYSNHSIGFIAFAVPKIPPYSSYKLATAFFKSHPKRKTCRIGIGKDNEVIAEFTRKDIES